MTCLFVELWKWSKGNGLCIDGCDDPRISIKCDGSGSRECKLPTINYLLPSFSKLVTSLKLHPNYHKLSHSGIVIWNPTILFNESGIIHRLQSATLETLKTKMHASKRARKRDRERAGPERSSQCQRAKSQRATEILSLLLFCDNFNLKILCCQKPRRIYKICSPHPSQKRTKFIENWLWVFKIVMLGQFCTLSFLEMSLFL